MWAMSPIDIYHYTQKIQDMNITYFQNKKQINKIEKKTSAKKNINASTKTTKTYKASLGYFIKNIQQDQEISHLRSQQDLEYLIICFNSFNFIF
ncbi:hypothetical protein pb186bvf_020666 [Paramecium bursaria]